ncbi:glycoside hydrolase family 55 protein [Bacillus cereus]|uniref:glycoside hydrolase family 55 protein n=1 Tax=Bacillus cereus TaxID=1396 RepID=UPI00222265E3|nr:glycoside hydrolase family 55 protein [Bacillus cereus]
MPINLHRWKGTAQNREFRNNTNSNWDQLEKSHNGIEEISDQAKRVADDANQKAKEANNLSESVQEQFNQVVIDGDSSVEAAQARVDEDGVAHPTLKARVDHESKKISGLAQKIDWIDVRDYGFIGDGIVDDTKVIQNAAADLPGKGTLKFPLSTFLLTKPIDIHVSDVEIDGSGSTIIWNGTTPLGNANRLIGMFNIKGSITTDKKLITSFDLKDKKNLYWATRGGAITLNDVSNLAIGDYVAVEIQTGGYNPNLLNTKVSILTKILNISLNTVYVEYVNPFPFPAQMTAGTLTKVNVVQNVKVKNFAIIDNTALKPGWVSTPFTSYPDADRTNIVSGISLQYAENCTVENVSGTNTKFPLVMANYTCRSKAININLEKPALIGGGEGYAVQFNSSLYCEATKCYGVSARHVVDFTASAFSNAKDIKGFDITTSTIQMHGAYEHDITFEDVIGKIGVVSGQTFGNANMNITFNRCSGTTISGLGFTVGYRLEKCNFEIDNVFTNAMFIDCDILWSSDLYESPDKRGYAIDSKIEIRGGLLTFDSSQDYCIIKDYDYIVINNGCNIKFVGITDGSVAGKNVDFENVKNFKVYKSVIDGVKLRPRGSYRTMEFSIDDNEIICKYAGPSISTKHLTNAVLIGTITNNTFTKIGNNASIAAAFPYPEDTIIGSTISATYSGNTFKGQLEVRFEPVGEKGTTIFTINTLRDGAKDVNKNKTNVTNLNNQIV